MITESSAESTLRNELNVSRETFADLELFAELLKKWNKSINLVSKTTIDELWSRHFLDSAQLWQYKPKELETWLDIGSGGGFPALVIAILAKRQMPNLSFHLIESDMRKCVFMRNVSRETSLKVNIHNDRIENIKNISADVISTRALAPTDKLFDFSHKMLKKNGICLFLKGKSYATELEKAQESWMFKSKIHKSLSQDGSIILQAWDIKHV